MRRPLSPARLCLLFIIVIFAGVVMMLANFDLEFFRSEIDYSLSQSLNRDVRLGKVHFSFKDGLALNCENVFVKDDSGTRLTADNLILSLSFQHLLQGELVWTGLFLVRPDLRLTLPDGQEKNGIDQIDTAEALGSLPNQENIRKIEIIDGHLLIHSQDKQAVPEIELNSTNLTLLREEGSSRFSINARTLFRQEKTPARLSISGHVTLDHGLSWKKSGLKLTLDADDLSLPAVPGGLAATLQLEGKPETGIKVTGNFDCSKIGLSGIPDFGAVFPRVQISTTVRSHPSILKFSDVFLESGPARFSGSVELPLLRDGAELNLQGDFTLQMTAGAQSMSHLLPQSSRWSITAGTVALRHINFQAPLALFKDPAALTERISADIQLNDLLLVLSEKEAISSIAGQAKLANGDLQLSRLTGTWQDFSILISGRIEDLTGSPRCELDGDIATKVETLLKTFSVDLPPDISLQGPLHLEARISNSFADPKFSLTANLDQLQFQGPHGLHKPPETRGALTLQGDMRPAPVLTAATLDLGPTKLNMTGSLPLNPKGSFAIDIDSPSIDLATLSNFFPPLERFQLRGTTSLNYHLEGDNSEIRQRHGRLNLRDAGAHLTRVIGDINKLNGTVLLTEAGGNTLPLKGQIGSSPASLQADVKLTNPFQVDVHVQGKAIRSNDLIFPSTKATLRNVDGHVVIDPQGIQFKQISVSLEGGTKAVVDGRMQGWQSPEVKLDITSTYGNIDEVIALWTDGPAREISSETHEKKPVTVDIDINAEAGKIGPLTFTNATTHLSHDGNGLLRIHPIKFDHKEGFGMAQVLADSRESGPTRLHISGHLEDFPADSIYRDVLEQRSLITGTMRGDFYLTGLAGEAFLETTLGGFAMEIHHGVLRRFNTLSKVFSLLNVSQILTFNVPDMAKEGMPFQKITGTMKLEAGLLQGEDLWIHSEAMDMSLVGNYNINNHRIDALLGIKPLKTVDKIITNLPIAGWLLAGEERSLVTAHFQISGEAKDPKVTAVPITSVSRKVFDIFKRVLQLPGKVILDPGEVLVPPAAQPKR